MRFKMKRMLLGSIIMIFISFMNAAQPVFSIEMQGPEGICYFEETDCYYLTDAREGKILKFDSERNLTTFKENLNVLMMPVIANKKLYVSSNDADNESDADNKIHCFDLISGAVLDSVNLSMITAIGGIAYFPPENSLYLVSQLKGFYRINLETSKLDTVNINIRGNDLTYDAENSRIIIARSGAKLSSYYPLEDRFQYLTNTLTGYYTSIIKSDKQYFLSDWAGKVYSYNNDLTERRTLLKNSDVNNPVGLYYNQKNDELLVCDYSAQPAGSLKIFCLSQVLDIKEYSFKKDNQLMNIYPNPFNPETKVQFNLWMDMAVSLRLYNVKGELIKVLDESFFPAGSHSYNLKMSEFESGTYFIKLNSGNNNISVKKIVLLK